MAVKIIADDGGLIIERNGDFASTLLIHGYGGSKEEMLPLGYRLARSGISSSMIDLPGHGETEGFFDLISAKKAIAERLQLMPSIKTIIGHSLGARMALLFDLPAICISPPLDIEFEGGRPELLRTLRVRRVREHEPFAGLRSVLAGASGLALPAMVLFGADDLKTVKDFASKAAAEGIETVKISGASHLDIMTARQTYIEVVGYLMRLKNLKR